MKMVFRSALDVVLVISSLTSMLPPASAQVGSNAQADRERAACDGVRQDRAACLREVGAAQQEAHRNGLTSEPGNYARNASARCQVQPMADRADCEARVRGTGTSSSEGSVSGGGILRETITPVPAPAK